MVNSIWAIFFEFPVVFKCHVSTLLQWTKHDVPVKGEKISGKPMKLRLIFCWYITNPLPSMYGIFTYIWLFWMVKYGFHVGKYTIVPWMVWECNHGNVRGPPPEPPNLPWYIMIPRTGWVCFVTGTKRIPKPTRQWWWQDETDEGTSPDSSWDQKDIALSMLGGAFKLFFTFYILLFGEVFQFDEHIFSDGLKPATSMGFRHWKEISRKNFDTSGPYF